MGRASGRDLGRIALMGAALVGCVALADCSASRVFSDKYSQRVVADGEPIPKGGGVYKVGQPYTVNGQTYYPSDAGSYRAEGVASWYGPDFHGRLTANGEVFDMHGISAAHPTMPIPSYARVTNLDNGRSLIVRVNDRGPYARNRIIDVSIGAAEALGFYENGLAHVRVEYVGRAPLEGSDDRMLLATLREGRPAQVSPQLMVASAESFVPNFDAEETPLPTERPFALGSSPAHQAAKSSNVSVAAVNSPPAAPASPDRSAPKPTAAKNQRLSDLSQDSPDTGPASPASRRNDTAVLGLMSARGLY
ncbi:MAG TPA: septal ring lytic transglycosylase RlpA family protein [Xanthobacteraceae bacterium]|jgi:rare lipoprotein A|nr:septal ring lytic transglycosylase RlpA family protein [Xanthobacteraceae bacterium]